MRPYFLQPYKVLPFLTIKKQEWPSRISRDYYLSFEDALWDLLPRLGYKKGSKILVPSFYCVDVIENMEAHGYKVFSYPIERDLSAVMEKVLPIITNVLPDIFIDFETAGVPNDIAQLIERKLPFHSLIINDRVHSVVGASIDNFPETDRHLILTSTRKVTPFPGSMALYTRSVRKSPTKLPKAYTAKALIKWAYYISVLKMSVLLHSQRLALFAEKILKTHDDLIGDAANSAPLPRFFLRQHDYINVPYIEDCKKTQFNIYQNALTPIFSKSNLAWTILNVAKFASKLRGYPLILANHTSVAFKKICRERGFMTVMQLSDCEWSKDQKLFLLPMGPHLTNKDIQKIANITSEALTGAIQYDTITA